MPHANYVKGRRKEYKVVNEAKEKGYIALRSAGSHSPIDVVIVSQIEGRVWLVQCKPESMPESAKRRLEEQWKGLTNYWEAHEVVNKELQLKKEFQNENSIKDRKLFLEGEGIRDVADREDLDNYYTQKGTDIQNTAKNMMELAKNGNNSAMEWLKAQGLNNTIGGGDDPIDYSQYEQWRLYTQQSS